MKKFFCILIITVTALFCFAACTNGGSDGNANAGNNEGAGGGDQTDNSQTGGNGETDNGNGETTNTPDETTSKILIAYFSCTNTTEAIANHIQAETNGTLYEIVPEVPYTEDDLKYYTNCRADKEQADPTARPAIDGSVEDMTQYDTVFIGYPIWHGQAPRIISTFLESYDFSDKTVIPFCTSHSSGIGSSDTNLHALASSANWISGRRFPSGTSQNTVAGWIEGLDLKLTPDSPATPPENDPEQEEITKMYLTVNGNKMEVTLAENSSVDALVEKLKEGDITFTADENGNFEMYGDIEHSLPANNTQISAQAGDVVLYSGRYLCLFFGSNSYSYTQIGKINGYSASELRTLLGADQGSVQVTISLN